jgi:putative transposase
MRTYKRYRIAGATYFFTVNLAKRNGNDLLVKHIEALREAFRIVMATHPFEIEAIVVLPDHLHAIWRMPPNDSEFPSVGDSLKRFFPRQFLTKR